MTNRLRFDTDFQTTNYLLKKKKAAFVGQFLELVSTEATTLLTGYNKFPNCLPQDNALKIGNKKQQKVISFT